MAGQIDIFGNIEDAVQVAEKSIKPVNDYIPDVFQSVNSLSGGKTSAYIAAHFPSDHNVFALVRIEDERCRFPDEKIRREVEDRIQAPFIGTAEDDTIIYTMLDLEQYIGQPIQWVTGATFDSVVNKSGFLPNKVKRFCTTEMKMIPIFEWVWREIREPVEMRVGYRANEMNRVIDMTDSLNENGLSMIKHTFRKWKSGRHKGNNKWEWFQWRKPVFPLAENLIYKWQIENYWEGRPVRFSALNNCVGCFHRNPILLRKMYDWNPLKMQWFEEQEGGNSGTWRSDFSYSKIKNHKLQVELLPSDFSECDSGFCGF